MGARRQKLKNSAILMMAWRAGSGWNPTLQSSQDAASCLGYVRNPVASAFSEMRWRPGRRVRRVNFAFLGVASSDAQLKKAPPYPQVLESACGLGYELLPLSLHRDLAPGQLNRRLKALNIQGVILDEIGHDSLTFPSFEWNAVDWSVSAWVSLGEGDYSHPGCRVLHNSFLATMDCPNNDRP